MCKKPPRPSCDNPPGVHVGRCSLLLEPQAAAHTLALQEVSIFPASYSAPSGALYVTMQICSTAVFRTSMQLEAAHKTHQMQQLSVDKVHPRPFPGRSCCSHRVHKEHHESFNSDPFSGLSMHWAESTIYFSSALLISPIVPLWVFRLLSLGLLVSVSSCTYLPFSTHLSFKQHEHNYFGRFSLWRDTGAMAIGRVMRHRLWMLWMFVIVPVLQTSFTVKYCSTLFKQL